MVFEFDPHKSAGNKKKHGIDFIEAQALWSGPTAESQTDFQGEIRRMVIGKIDEKLWTAIITKREFALRIISVRRARPKETGRYEQKFRS